MPSPQAQRRGVRLPRAAMAAAAARPLRGVQPHLRPRHQVRAAHARRQIRVHTHVAAFECCELYIFLDLFYLNVVIKQDFFVRIFFCTF